VKTIFVVDDSDTNLATAKAALEGSYKVFTIPSAQKMFKLAEKIIPDLILLDVDMPEMDGFQAMELLKADAKMSRIPVMFLTARSDAAVEVRGFELGAVDFVTKPFSAPVLLKHIEMHIGLDELIKKRTEQLIRQQNGIISVMADIVESRDQITGGHIERTQKYLEILLTAMLGTGLYAEKISGWDMNIVIPSAQLHDIGKISVPDHILNKPGKLEKDEFEAIRAHAAEGARLVDKIAGKIGGGDFLVHAKLFAAAHHEKWNGTGYPKGLSGEEIPLQGRVMAIADVYDALISERPYKKPFSHEEAVELIKNDAGTAFDPKIVEVFLNVADEFWVEVMIY
jgi:putative two-component system response regulator